MRFNTKFYWIAKNLINFFVVCVRILLHGLTHPKKFFQLLFSIYSTINEFYKVSHSRLHDFSKTATAKALSDNTIFARCNALNIDSDVTRPMEIQTLATLTYYLRPQKIFEIGTYNGFTTIHFAYNSPSDCRIYTLDLPPNYDARNKNELHKYSYDDLKVVELSMKNIDKRVFKNDPNGSKITELFGDSASFDFSPYHNKIDLVFIDGNHAYDYVKSDTENAFKMLSDNGIILWHDFDYIIHQDVFRYLNKLGEKYKIYSIQNTRFAIYGKDL